MRKFLLAAAAVFMPLAAHAQCAVPVVTGQVWTSTQWNNCFNYLLTNTGTGSSSFSGSNFNSTFPSQGIAFGASSGGNMVSINADAFHDMMVNLATPLPTGSNVIGAVTENGTWTVGISGAVPLPNGAAQNIYTGAFYNTAAPVLTNGQQTPLQVDSNGNLKVNIVTGGGAGGGGGTSSQFGSSFPYSGTAMGASNGGNMQPLSVDNTGDLLVNLATALPKGTNTIGAVTQGGTWSVGLTNALPTGNNTIGAVSQGGAWNVGISGGLPLPTGASSAANQTAPQGSVIGGTAATTSDLAGGIYNATVPTLTTGQQAAVQLDASGNLKVNIAAGASSGGTSSAFGSAFPTNGTAIGGKYSGNMIGLAADSVGNLQVNLQTPIPAGTNAIGSVTQGGTWNVGNLTNITGTITLPTGAATAANQTATQGPVSAGTSATASTLGGAVYSSTPPAPTTGQQTALQADSHGSLRTAAGAVTLVALDASSVVTGGTAVTALAAGHRTAGGWIANPISAAVNLCINEIGSASGTTSSGSTTCIAPGQTYVLAASGNAVSVVSSDSSHAFSGQGRQ